MLYLIFLIGYESIHNQIINKNEVTIMILKEIYSYYYQVNIFDMI